MAKVRLGVALLFPPALAREIDGLRRALGAAALGRIPPHLTIVPPVNVREDRVPDALAVLRAAAAATRPFTLELGLPATFLPVTPVLYLAVGGDRAAVAALRDRIWRDPLDRPLARPFHPHVTVTDDAPADRIAAAIVALADYRATATVDRVHLLAEGPGRIWEPMADAAFAAPAVIGRGGLELELSVSDRLGPEAARLADGAGRPFAVTARREGRVVGVARGHTVGEDAVLDALVVHPDSQGEGIGSHLIAAVESLAAASGGRRLWSALPAGRGGAFLRSRGWSEIPDAGGGSVLGRHLG